MAWTPPRTAGRRRVFRFDPRLKLMTTVGRARQRPSREHQGPRFLLAGIAVELAFAAAVIYLPALQGVFGTEALTPAQLAIVAPFPLIVWGADEIRRMLMRRYRTGRQRSPAD
jgi:hypothetical protein